MRDITQASKTYLLMGEREGRLISLGYSYSSSSPRARLDAFRWAVELSEDLDLSGRWPEGFDLVLEERSTGRRWACIDDNTEGEEGWEEI